MADKKLKPIEGLTPELQSSIESQVSEFCSEAREEGKIAGATAERERIQAVEGQSMAGHEALIASVKFDGKTTGPEAAVMVINAEKEKAAKKLVAIRADAPAPITAQPTDGERTAAAAEAEKKNADPYKLAREAQNHFDAMEKAGTPVTMIEATKAVYEKHGIPLQ